MLRMSRISVVVACLSGPSFAQTRAIVNDRTNDAMYRFVDANGNGFIDEPGEVNLWFNLANAPGTLGPMNPTCLAVSRGGVVIMGDQLNRNVYRLRDLNGDGDAQDAGESVVFADATNVSGVSFAFPTGAAFDSHGEAYVVNSGNASGDDGVYRLVDLSGDGDAQDAGEITPFVTTGAFGPGNGPYSPQEIVFDRNDVCYLRNSSTGLHGIYRCEDLNHNGRADDAGEFTVFWDASNASGVAALAGFSLDIDRVRARAFYTLQTATGGVDQLVRVVDVNGDGDAQDAGESAIVWETSEAGFTGIDAVCLCNGDVLVTDNSGNRVIRLHDGNGDGDFMDAGERTDYFLDSTAVLGVVRQYNTIELLGDINDDEDVDSADATILADVLVGMDSDPRHVCASDLNGDGLLNGLDVQVMVGALP